MRIKQKLIVAFVGIVLLMGFGGYISIDVVHKAFNKNIGQGFVLLAGSILDRIDKGMNHRVEQVQAYSKDISQEPAFISSNENFDEMDDVQKYIIQKDSEWTTAPKEMITPFMQELLNNELSEEIRGEFELKEFYEQKYGYPVFAEVFVTNKYGANIGQTQKTSDYYQADEEWWQRAKEDGLYVSKVDFDKSSNVYSMDICVRIDDEEGKFLGVIKTVLNIEELTDIIKEIHNASQYKTMRTELLTLQGEMLYKTGEYEFLKKLPEEELSFYKDASGYFVLKECGEEEEMIAYAYSRTYKDVASLGWLVVVEGETEEICAPVIRLRNYILIILSVTTILSILAGLFISGFISKRLKLLGDAATEIGKGNLDTLIGIKSNDEIGNLAKTFNSMTEKLRKNTTSIEKLDCEITERKKAEGSLRTTNQQLQTNEIYLQKLNQLQVELLKPGTIAEKSKIITNAVMDIFDADFCRIWLTGQGDRCNSGCIHAEVTEGPHVCRYRDKCLYLTSSSGRYTHINGEVHQRVPFGCYKIGRVAAEDESKFLTNDVTHDPRVHNHDWAAECGLASFAGYQLRPPGGETIGVLALFSKHPISPDENAFLENFANTTAQVMQTVKTEQELVNSKGQLSHSNKELEQTVDTLETVNTELKDFVYIASHDLREPLRKISSFGSMLKDSLAGKLEADDEENFEFMIDGADRMTKMIEGLLVYSRLNRDNESFEAVDLNELVEQLEQLELNILLEETNTILDVSGNMPKVLGDATQIKQLLQNFISNGINTTARHNYISRGIHV